MFNPIKMRALWRHPTNSHKRKAFRAGGYTLASAEGARGSRVWVNLAAILRFPFSANRRRTWRDAALYGTNVIQSAAKHAAMRAAGLGDPSSEALHARLYDCYVQNALGQFDSSEYVDIASEPPPTESSDVKLIAYYLPQFHPIPENDEWWGKGFTEWRNVARAYPQFEGHYQPRVPGELGYYDLRIVDVMRRQVELAKLYGIHAFCFHFYWFGGKRLLETPILNYLENKDLDLPFCLCWANENWSRRWDGSEHEVLISQSHSAEDDAALLAYIDKYFRDERYLKINGKPVLTVYRPSILPDAAKTVERWRQIAEELGYPGIYLIATNSFAFTDYQKFGFDALSEFPPHHVLASNVQNEFQMSHHRTGWRVRSYAEIVTSEESRKPVAGTVLPGVMPGWDNSARRPANGEIIHGATPSLFEQWLNRAFVRAQMNRAGERFVIINAWNEWAEGAYLEPDTRFGYANLEVCGSVIRNHVETAKSRLIMGKRVERVGAKTILLCAHHAGRQIFGGERSFLDVARGLVEAGFNIVVTLQEGVNVAYIKELQRHAQAIHIFKYNQWTSDLKATYDSTPQFLDIIDAVKVDLVYVNTIVVAAPLAAAKLRGIPTIVHAREIILHDKDLQQQIGKNGAEIVQEVLASSHRIIANSQATAECFADGNVTTILNTIDLEPFDLPLEEAGDIVTFGLISSNFAKKGIEDFIKLAQACVKSVPMARFVAIGPVSRPLVQDYVSRKKRAPRNFNFIDYQPTSIEAINLVDVVVNFSHFQESFGRTILEGMAARRPSIVYEWGALKELVRHEVTGFLVPFGEPAEAVKYVQALCANRALLRKMGEAARERAANYAFPHFKQKLENVCRDVLRSENRGPDVYARVRDDRLKNVADKSVDIVICVHNALRDVRACLASVQDNLGKDHRVILIDDGSDEETRTYLANFMREKGAMLHRNEIAQGYTKAANAGMALSKADLVILLNSDTIVTKNWAEKMVDAVFSTPKGGAVGPMSNAASYQSIPSVMGTDKQTALNDLLLNMSPNDMSEWCEMHSSATVPSVPLVHGFCLGITREALDSVGNFDETAFPNGYGEENDFCFRLAAAGFQMVVATHTYVYHVKSSSYTEARRHELSTRAQKVLNGRYGPEVFGAAVRLLEQNTKLVIMRTLAESLYEKAQTGLIRPAKGRQPRTHLLSALDDVQWLETLQASVDNRIVDGIEYPGFPDPSLQVSTVGSAGRGTVAEGFRFYSFILNATKERGLRLKPDSRVLDFGVGWGRIIRCFLRDVSPSGLYGVDTNDRFLTAARQSGVPGDLRLIQPDGKLPFDDNTFDVVYAYSVFTHLPEHIQNIWLAEIARTLRPGGIFVATVQPPRFLDFIRKANKDKVAKSFWLQQLQGELAKLGNPDAELKKSNFIFLPTNNGKTYGDTIMTSAYVERVWGQHFRIVGYLDDVSRFQQAVVTAEVQK